VTGAKKTCEADEEEAVQKKRPCMGRITTKEEATSHAMTVQQSQSLKCNQNRQTMQVPTTRHRKRLSVSLLADFDLQSLEAHGKLQFRSRWHC
jgi:hypothetical protein